MKSLNYPSRTLSLSFCDLLSDNALKWVQTMKHLKNLRLKKGTEFSANALKELFCELHHLRMHNKTGLLHLDLPECSEVDDVVLATVAKRYCTRSSCSIYPTCRSLSHQLYLHDEY